MKVICPTCKKEYKSIGQHWAFKDSHRPELSEEQKEIIKGLTLGDGCIATETGANNSIFVLGMTTKKFVCWVDEKLGKMSRGCKLSRTAAQSAELSSEDFSSNPENYNDIYRVDSRPHPYFTKLREELYRDKKIYPESLELTPTKLKMWYVSDGNIEKQKNIVRITNTVQIHDSNFSSIFSNTGLSPTIKPESEAIFILSSDFDDFFSYIGDAPPGFEYKWPEKFN